ncbi:MAG: hypothetical protein A4S14_02295 [Proteobacteria bacterium SG_bin9]|nr:MAG: hypothetical protein A4S14_02295 [Proteobacteria bacterium SG_bin9]
MPVLEKLTIGKVAARTGCSVPTIRYYESIGLLPKPGRGEGHQRIYSDSDCERLTFIRRSRDFGFPIDQVRQLLVLFDAPQQLCDPARDIAVHQLADVRQKLDELLALERSLKGFVDGCNDTCAGGPAEACVIVKELAAPCCK